MYAPLLLDFSCITADKYCYNYRCSRKIISHGKYKNTATPDSQNFMRIQDLFYLCINRWYWFVISLAVCLGIATYYILTTPSVYTRNASILIKDESKGKSATAEMDNFADLGLFTSNANVNSEIVTLKSRDLMREVVSRLHLNMEYHVDGRFQKPTIYGEQLPVHAEIVNFKIMVPQVLS